MSARRQRSTMAGARHKKRPGAESVTIPSATGPVVRNKKKRTEPARVPRRASASELRQRLAEAEETLRAIREGHVDAVVVQGSDGEQVYSLHETENVYRRMIETIRQPAVAMARDGAMVFCNDRFREMAGLPEQTAGHAFLE